MIKQVLFAAAALGIALSSASAADKLRIGTEGAYPPFNNLTSDGKLVGFDIDIARALCDEMKVECEFVTQDWDGIIPALIASKYDAIIASMSITDERKEKVSFSEKYYNTPPALAVPKDSTLSADDLSNAVIGAQSSTTHANYAEQKLSAKEIKLYPTADEYKLDIENERVDAVIDDIVVLSDWIADGGDCCKILTPLTPDPVINGEGAGIAVRKGEEDLAAKFSAAITAIIANGKYKEINDKYFSFDVYGG